MAEKDRLDRIESLAKALGAILVPLAIVFIALIGNHYLQERQNQESKLKLFTELMSDREQSESTLRKDMFEVVLTQFFKKTENDKQEHIELQILNLELLTYNFSDSLDLNPLFINIVELIEDKYDLEEKNCGDIEQYELNRSENKGLIKYCKNRKRVEKLANITKKKQLTLLEQVGVSRDITIEYEQLDSCQSEYPNRPFRVFWQILELNDIKREVQVQVINIDQEMKEIELVISVMNLEEKDFNHPFYVTEDTADLNTPNIFNGLDVDKISKNGDNEKPICYTDLEPEPKCHSDNSEKIKDQTENGQAKKHKEYEKVSSNSNQFTLGYFDFPTINNTRLSHNQRLAVVLNNFEEASAEASLIIFPGSYSSLKDRPFYDDLINKLNDSN
ncbi:MAG: hypothetical protein O6943_07190 [Bacteroidetes bacterium]|nr:hypothetical protein [Bacteroidota bacterium]